MKKCTVCQSKLQGKQKKFCSNKCKGKHKTHQRNNYEAQRERAQRRKITLVELLGGKCDKCGYDDNFAALCFHHRDPSKKEAKLDARMLANMNWDSVKEEAAKCQLLCHNCHMEEHYPNLHKDNIKQSKYDKSYTGRVDKPNQIKPPVDLGKLQQLLIKKSIRKVADDYNVSDMTIRNWIKEFNLKTPIRGTWNKLPRLSLRKPGRPPKEQLIKLRKEYSAEELAIKYDVTSRTIRRWLI